MMCATDEEMSACEEDLYDMTSLPQENMRRGGIPFSAVYDWAARALVWALVVIFPIIMGPKTYRNITLVKMTAFGAIVGIFTVILVFTTIFFSDELHKESTLKIKTRPGLFRADTLFDAALLGFIALALVSSIFAAPYDKAVYGQSASWLTAFAGQGNRNNGFIIQATYAMMFFVISKLLKPKAHDALIFVWGGLIFAVLCQLHLFGVDLYGVGKSVGEKYAGPFLSKKTEFMGPIGNVNLASYFLTAACVLAAGLYINKVAPKFDKYNITTICSFAFLLWAELNINTDAGLVGLAAGFAIMIPVLAGSVAHVRRMMTVFSAAGLTMAFDKFLIDFLINGKSFGGSGKAGLAVGFVCALAALVIWLLMERRGVSIAAKKLRISAAVLLIVAVAGVLAAAYVSVAPEVDPVNGEIQTTFASPKSGGNPLTELGHMLHGRFDDTYGHNRLFTWKRTLSVVKKQPLIRTIIGSGPDSFTGAFASYYGAESKVFFKGKRLDKAHNEFLDILINQGILGLIAYLAFFGLLIWSAFRTLGRKNSGGAAPALGVAVIAFLAHAFFGYQLPIQSPIMWVMVALCGAFVINSEQKDSQPQSSGVIVN